MSIPQEDNFVAFAATASEFCTFIDGWRQGRPDNLYKTLEVLLGQLHCGILAVPIDGGPNLQPGSPRPVEEWREVVNLVGRTAQAEISELIGWHGENTEDSTRSFMFDDDLTDIFFDLREGIRACCPIHA